MPRHLKATQRPEGKFYSALIPGDRKCSTTGKNEEEEFGGIQSHKGCKLVKSEELHACTSTFLDKPVWMHAKALETRKRV